MVKLNWEGKIECKNNINLLNYNKAYQCDLIESIISPLNANLEKDAYLKNLNAKREGIDNKRENIWKNKLFWGDNSIILNFLLKDFQEKINLIYFDPPFGSGGDFDYIIQIGEGEAAKKASKWLRKRSYSDSWKEGLNSYFNFMYKRLLLMRKLLSPKGSIYIHLDWHISHYIKIILDEIFGVDNFRNEIIWAYPAASVQTRRFFMRSYDVILFYSKSEDYVFNDDPNIYMEYSNRVKNALKKDEKGVFYYRGGSHNGKKLSQKVYVKENGIFPRDVWKDIPYIRANTIEYQGFSTQKPERLLKRIILASTNENDLVADFFCGSGTTLIVAEKLGRRWIGCDRAKHAIHITKKRLLDVFNSNNLLDWKDSYNKLALPFEIFKVSKVKNKSMLSEESPKFNIDIKKQDKIVIVELKDFIIPNQDNIPDNLRKKIMKWSDWVDYWAIDFDYKENLFNMMWVSYRTPKNRELNLISHSHKYEEGRNYIISIKAVDIFGNETMQKYTIEM